MLYKRTELYNIAQLFKPEDGQGKNLCRVPLSLRRKLNQSAQANSIQGTGCEIRFNLLSDSATITLQMHERQGIAEVYHGPFIHSWHVIETKPTEIPIAPSGHAALLSNIHERETLPFDPGLIRVRLPWRPPVRIIDIKGKFAPPRPEQTPKTKYLAYGSSISHGNMSVRPTSMYTMRTSQLLGVDLINLGFGGGAHLEREMADYIAARGDWDFATIEMGINVLGLEVEEFASRVEYFVSTIAKANRKNWVFCIDLFRFSQDFMDGSKQNRAFRKVVRDTVKRLALPKLVHLDGRKLLKDPCGLTTDLVHPSPIGMEEIAQNLSRVIRGKVGL